MTRRSPARPAAWRWQRLGLWAAVIGLVLIGALARLGAILARDFWVLVIAWVQP